MNLKSIITLLLLSSFSLFAESVGDASWYGEKFQGKPTASGEPFDMYAYTAAHRTLPFGTMIKVTNLSNNKSVKVRINDRGPFKKNRIVDLSYKAAKEIGIVQEGIAEVSIEEIDSKDKTASKSVKKDPECIDSSTENPYLTNEEIESMKEYAKKSATSPEETYSSKDEYEYKVDEKESIKVQIAAFSEKINAESFMEEEKGSGFTLEIVEVYSESAEKNLYKVVILCNSKNIAKDIIDSRQYRGAYLLH